MQSEEAERIREKWDNKPPCSNPKFEKEYILGSDTGDRVCRICGHYDFEHSPKGPTFENQD